MRIISSYRDYYDTAMGFGVDQSQIYQREPRKLAKGVKSRAVFTHDLRRYCKDEKLKNSSHTIGFCGKVYLVEVLEYGDNKAYCYNIEAVDKFIDQFCSKKQIKAYYGGKSSLESRWSFRKTFGISGFRRFSMGKSFKLAEERRDMHLDFFIEHKVPIFVDSTLNACLKDYEFFRVMDPYTAYQELQMFFGSGIAPEPKIPEVSDADLLECKGFDPKFSFRKAPGTKRGRKKGKK